jgi:hypothetical protein
MVPMDELLVAPPPRRTTVAAAGVRFRPGHYVRPCGLHWTPQRQDADFRFFDAVGGNPHVAGFVVHFTWAYFEGSPGDYSRGFRIVDAYLDKVASLPTPKSLILHVADRSFGEPTANVYPPYIVNNGWVAVKPADRTWPGGLVSVAKLWRISAMDRLIAMSRAYAARYDAHPNLAMYGLGEPALGPGLAADGSLAHLKRWFTESKKVWTRTPLRLCVTSAGDDADLLDLIDHASSTVRPGGVAIGGPDPELPLPTPVRTIQANRLFRGERPATRDLRGVVPWVGEVRELGLGDRYTETPQEISDYFHHRMRCNYMIWLANTLVGGDAQRWPAILAHLAAIRGRTYPDRPTLGVWS